MTEAVCGGEPLRRLVGGAVREHRVDAEADQMCLAPLEECGAKASPAVLGLDADLQEPRSLGALVLDRRGRPADEPTTVPGGPVAALGIDRRCVGPMSETTFGADAMRPHAVQELVGELEVLALALPHHIGSIGGI